MAWQNAPSLKGAILWGIDENYRMMQNWQDGRGSFELTAAGQNNNCVQLWAVTMMGTLTSIAQIAPACNWQQHWSDRDD